MNIAAYITGFADGEGCFSISFNQRSQLRTNIEVRPSFCIAQNERSRHVLQEIQRYFACGHIRHSANDCTDKYEVRKVNDLNQKIIPHFKQYPLRTAKRYDFILFSHICSLVGERKHLDPRYLSEIIETAYRMNHAGTRKYTAADLLRILQGECIV